MAGMLSAGCCDSLSSFTVKNIAAPICRLRPERCDELFSGRSLGFVISLTLGSSSRPEKERINVTKMALVGVVAATLAFPADALAWGRQLWGRQLWSWRLRRWSLCRQGLRRGSLGGGVGRPRVRLGARAGVTWRGLSARLLGRPTMGLWSAGLRTPLLLTDRYWGYNGCYRSRTVRTGWGRAQPWVNVRAYQRVDEVSFA